MAILTREQILAVQDRKTETVPVPEWGGEVLVASMMGDARDKLEAQIASTDGPRRFERMRAKMVSAAVVDESGNLLFSETDVPALGKKSALALQRVFNVAMRLSGFRRDDIEELVGDLPDAQSASSTSD
jgi:hypothetical protein